MELNELATTWQTLEKRLERGNQLSLEMLRLHKVDRLRRSLWPLKLNQAFQIGVGLLFIALAGLLWRTKPSAVSVILGGVVIQVYGIGCIITAGILFASLNRVDFAAPVLEVQAGIAQVRRAYGICTLVAGLSWWFLWIPLLILFAGLAHISLYAHAPSVIWIGVAIGVAGLSGTHCIYRYSRKSSNAKLRELIQTAAFGSTLQNAVQQLHAIHEFEEETLA